MKQERKEALLLMVPRAPLHLMRQMKNHKGVSNFAVMLTEGRELFVRCFHEYSDGRLEERQRYVFAKDGCFRAGSDDGRSFTVRRDFREPVFCKTSYGYSFDNSYLLMNADAWRDSDMRFSAFDRYTGKAPMEYLRLYCRHPNIEYLMKTGYTCTVMDDDHYLWYGQRRTAVALDPHINCKSNDLLKMLGLNRTEFKVLRGHECEYGCYLHWREQYPKGRPEELLLLAQVFRSEQGTASEFADATGLRLPRLARYLQEHDVSLYDYRDYLGQCRKLGYNMHDTAIAMPHDFGAIHTRLSEMICYRQNEAQRAAFAAHLEERMKLEYTSGALCIRQPRSIGEIVREGKVLCHCVGGYAKRHAEGRLNILFIRRGEAPDEPYFTMELSMEGKVIQVRGLRNCDPPEEVRQLVESYKDYIRPLFAKQRKTERVRVSA